MKPLVILLSCFIIAVVILKSVKKEYDFPLSGRLSMSVMLLFTAIGHFLYTEGMAMMLPEFIPFKRETVYLTGFIEIAAAIGLLLPNFRIITGWLLIVFFIMILPANIYAAVKHVDYQKAAYQGSGTAYLFFRVPLQLIFIIWTYMSTIR